MKTFREESGLCTIRNECLHPQKLVFTTSFEALRIVKDEFVVALENKFVLDVMHSALKKSRVRAAQYRVSARRITVLVPTPLDPSTSDGSI